MHTIRFWLVDDDCRIIERLAAGLGRKSACVCAYLALQADRGANPATRLEIHIGSNLNQNAVSEALRKLEECYLLPETTLPDDSRGRPPKVWRPVGVLDELARQTYDKHATALLRRAGTLYCGADAIGAEAVDVTDRNPGAKAAVILRLNWRLDGLYTPFYAVRCGGHYDERKGLGLAASRHDGRSYRRRGRRLADPHQVDVQASGRGVRRERDSPQSRPGILAGRHVGVAQNRTPAGGPAAQRSVARRQ